MHSFARPGMVHRAMRTPPHADLDLCLAVRGVESAVRFFESLLRIADEITLAQCVICSVSSIASASASATLDSSSLRPRRVRRLTASHLSVIFDFTVSMYVRASAPSGAESSSKTSAAGVESASDGGRLKADIEDFRREWI